MTEWPDCPFSLLNFLDPDAETPPSAPVEAAPIIKDSTLDRGRSLSEEEE